MARPKRSQVLTTSIFVRSTNDLKARAKAEADRRDMRSQDWLLEAVKNCVEQPPDKEKQMTIFDRLTLEDTLCGIFRSDNDYTEQDGVLLTIDNYWEVIKDDGKIDSDNLLDPLTLKVSNCSFLVETDLFNEDVLFDDIDKIFSVMSHCPRHTFIVSTQYPARAFEYINETQKKPLKNLLLCVSKDAEEREPLEWLPKEWRTFVEPYGKIFLCPLSGNSQADVPIDAPVITECPEVPESPVNPEYLSLMDMSRQLLNKPPSFLYREVLCCLGSEKDYYRVDLHHVIKTLFPAISYARINSDRKSAIHALSSSLIGQVERGSWKQEFPNISVVRNFNDPLFIKVTEPDQD